MKSLQQGRKIRAVVVDANILITLLNMNCLDILAKLDKYEFWMPIDVKNEIHRKTQRAKLRRALKLNWLKELEITEMADMELYAKYRKRFGKGESSCMAVGFNRGWIVASDEKAVKKEVIAVAGVDNLLDSRTIFDEAVNAGFLSKSEFKELNKNFEQTKQIR